MARRRDHGGPAGPFGGLVPPDPLMELAWAGCLRYAIGDPGILAAFRAETGHTWSPGRAGLDRAADEATGAGFDFFRAFAAWHNENIWGDIHINAGEG